MATAEACARRAGVLAVGDLLRVQAMRSPNAPAVTEGERTLSYEAFNMRVNRAANALRTLGVARGARVAILSENRTEYVELEFACAKLGAIACALNWRLADPELAHCIRLVAPAIVVVSARFASALGRIDHLDFAVLMLGAPYETALAAASTTEPHCDVDPEDGLLVLYTSGTTGLPKGALISHRAEVARMHVAREECGLAPGDGFVAWPPMFHMASSDQMIACLCTGAHVFVVDGFDLEKILPLIARHRLWWLMIIPGTVDRFCAALIASGITAKGIKRIGAMADLVPPQQIAEITALLQAPYANTFGSTETGIPPASAGLLAVGQIPASLAKTVNALCEIRLVDAEDRDVPDGEPGELVIRGPTLFSGYWNAPQATAHDFRGGWFHLGDVFRRHPDGTLSFADRVKYLIKTGGENVYPAEIERVLLADPRVTEAVVVRKADAQWGEVPIAFVARSDAALTADALLALCRAQLAGYKRPKEIHFVPFDQFPRSTTGKVQRGEVERWVR
ncbi:MAG TPA: AMP-binding protein [Casimicrobiaceae bacterium]|nr:AMP-binding protein [Casimicrobiaceae bacterium]